MAGAPGVLKPEQSNILGSTVVTTLGSSMEEETEMQESEPTIGVEKFLNSVILVTTKDGRKFRGKLTHYDDHMNIILENTEELSSEGPVAKHKLILLKGGNISAIST